MIVDEAIDSPQFEEDKLVHDLPYHLERKVELICRLQNTILKPNRV